MVLVHVCIIDHFLTLKAFIVLNEKQAIAFIFHVYYVHKVIKLLKRSLAFHTFPSH